MTQTSLPVSASDASAGIHPGRPHRRQRRLVDGHFRGQVSPTDEREMRQHLVICDGCRDYYRRHLRLAAVDPERALPMRDRLARGLGLRPVLVAPRRPGWLGVLGAVTACALVLLAFAIRGRDTARPPRFQPRGAAGSAPAGQLLVYEIARGQPARQAITDVSASSALAFAYANIAHRRRLMVFAVDQRRQVYWYHPAWNDAAQDPIALEIAGDDAIHELPQAIIHQVGGRSLQIFGVFLDDPRSVRQIETQVSRAPAGPDGRIQLVVPGADVTVLDLRVKGVER